MKKYLFVLFFFLGTYYTYSQSAKLDTIYYDKDWKGVSNAAFASFYRVYDANDKSEVRKPMRDYYISGELQSEGSYINIDKNDDSKSVFDGEYTNYFKSGKIEQKGNRVNGVLEGEYTSYYENGLVKMHTFVKNGKSDGILTEFSEQGDVCTQTEMINGEPKYDYFIVSNKDGYSSKIRISDGSPIWESAKLSEKQTEYKDGKEWAFYTKNGIMIAMHPEQLKDYGKWFRLSIIIANNSIESIVFDPEKITSSLQKTNGQNVALEVWSSDRYMKKVRRSQNLNSFFNALGEGLAAMNAGYSTSTTQTNSTYNGYSNTYGSASAFGSSGYAYGTYSGYGTYTGNSSTTSRTVTYNGAAAYQAQVIASNRVAEYENSLLQERTIKEEGYLRKTTLYPGDAISGYINIKYVKGALMTVYVDINGAIYEFPWAVTK